MINSIKYSYYNPKFRSKEQTEEFVIDKNNSHLLEKGVRPKINREAQKIMSAFIDYPTKGLMGDINSNFYEFLSMGMIPTVIGSLMFMLTFNITKHLDAKGYKTASSIGRKMAMGVILYALLKDISKFLVTQPVKITTGVDTELPYENKVSNLPKEADENADPSVRWQQRKIFDSKDFYRKDLLNEKYYVKVAKKIGLGENLNDPVGETSPIIQNIVTTSNLAKSFSKYAWAAVGVGMAVQNSWLDFYDKLAKPIKFKAKNTDNFTQKLFGKAKALGQNIWYGSLAFVKSFFTSAKQLWDGNPAKSGISKHAGKTLILFATFLTAFLTSNVIFRAKSLAKYNNVSTIDENKEYKVI